MTANISTSHMNDEKRSTRNKNPTKNSLRDAMMKTASKFAVIEEDAPDQPLHSPMRQLSQSFRDGALQRSNSGLSLSLRCATSEHDQPLHLPMRQLSKRTSNRLMECSASSDLSLSLRCATAEHDHPLHLPTRQLSASVRSDLSASNRTPTAESHQTAVHQLNKSHADK